LNLFSFDKKNRLAYIKGLSGNNSVVECNLAKVEVAGSNPVSRSIIKSFPASYPQEILGGIAKWLRQRSAKPLFTGSSPVAASKQKIRGVD
jgi:hypothetical protein